MAALFVALRANSISHRQPFVGQQLGELVSLRAAALEVHRLYTCLFEDFPTVDAKRQARLSFLKAQEGVTVQLEFLGAAFPELAHLVKLWESLVDIEDSHAANDALTFGGSLKMIQKKGGSVTQFISATAECVRSLGKSK